MQPTHVVLCSPPAHRCHVSLITHHSTTLLQSTSDTNLQNSHTSMAGPCLMKCTMKLESQILRCSSRVGALANWRMVLPRPTKANRHCRIQHSLPCRYDMGTSRVQVQPQHPGVLQGGQALQKPAELAPRMQWQRHRGFGVNRNIKGARRQTGTAEHSTACPANACQNAQLAPAPHLPVDHACPPHSPCHPGSTGRP